MPRAELFFRTEDDDAPIAGAWIYLRQGTTTTLLHTNDRGCALGVIPGKDATRPWEYETQFLFEAPATGVLLLHSKGARPIPTDALTRHAAAFVKRDITLPKGTPVPALVATNELNTLSRAPQVIVRLPRAIVSLVTPAELSLWPLLWHAPAADYYTHGIPQGANPPGAAGPTWFGPTGLRDSGPSPVPTARPTPRGLLLQGTIDARATGIDVFVYSVATGLLVKQRSGPADTVAGGHDSVPATPSGAVSAGARPFEKALYFLDPAEAFGPVVLVLVSKGIAPNPVVGAFAVHLAGVQGALVDDHAAQRDGSQMGPVQGEPNEVNVVDFTSSPTDFLGGQTATNVAQRRLARVRRMVVYRIKADRARALVRVTPAVNIVHNEMPLWMAELHWVGVRKVDLEDLLERRRRLLPGAPATLTFAFRWRVEMEWKGPDSSLPATGWATNYNASHGAAEQITAANVFSYRETHEGIWTATGLRNEDQVVTLRLDATGALEVDAADATKARAPFSVAPVPLPFPTTTRRAPAVFLSGQGRAWGRVAGAAAKDTLVMEWQVAILNAAGQEVMRGGNCSAVVPVVQIDAARVHQGVADDGTSFGADVPDVPLPVCRVLGTNANAAAVTAAVVAVTDRFYDEHPTYANMVALTLGSWRAATATVCTHESGNRQFDDRAGEARFLNDTRTSFGHEMWMPFFGGPRGYGIGQKDPHPPLDAIFNYVEAIVVACDELMHVKSNAANTDLRGVLGVANVDYAGHEEYRAALLRGAVRRYNGGREFVSAGPGVLAIRPRTSASHRNYPNDALHTTVPYADLDATPPPPHIPWIRAYYWPNGGTEPP